MRYRNYWMKLVCRFEIHADTGTCHLPNTKVHVCQFKIQAHTCLYMHIMLSTPLQSAYEHVYMQI
jgi:hypothetical protein